MKDFFKRVKNIFARKSELKSSSADKIIEQHQQDENLLAKEVHIKGLFYRNPGLNRNERRTLDARLRKSKLRLSQRETIKKLLRSTAMNVPYERWMQQSIPDFSAKAKDGIVRMK